MEGILTHCKWQ